MPELSEFPQRRRFNSYELQAEIVKFMNEHGLTGLTVRFEPNTQTFTEFTFVWREH